MRFVEPKSEEQQARAIMFRAREQLVNQRTELVNALRAHLYEFGYIAPHGIRYLTRLEGLVEDEAVNLPELVRAICRGLLDHIRQMTSRIDALSDKIDALSSQADTTRRLRTMPGIGPITALAIETFAPPMEVFSRGRDFAAWLGLARCCASRSGCPSSISTRPLQKTLRSAFRPKKIGKMHSMAWRRPALSIQAGTLMTITPMISSSNG